MIMRIAPALLVAAMASAGSADQAGPGGLWRTQMHGALVEMRSCADGSPCAFLAWVDPAMAAGVTHDRRHPDPALRSRPLIGVPILWGLRPSGDGWTGGRVYNPETGQIFRSALAPLAGGRLRVTGCWGPFCRSEIWVRAPAATPPAN